MPYDLLHIRLSLNQFYFCPQKKELNAGEVCGEHVAVLVDTLIMLLVEEN